MKKGIFAVYKPVGMSSYDLIRSLKKHFPGEKIGHGGTLDPLADGVLVVGVGREATRQLGTVLRGTDKVYEVDITLGMVSETDDAEGPLKKSYDGKPIEQSNIRKVIKKYIGDIQQVPPKYSAIKIAGQPAYKRARKGEDFHIEPKQVTIHDIEILEYAYPHLKLKVTTASGVYIRSLARDIGEALGTGAYVQSLTRTAVGDYGIQEVLYNMGYENTC